MIGGACYGVFLTFHRLSSPEKASERPTDRGRLGWGVTHWPDLEAALQGRAGWRRVGRDYHGPCPVSGAGRDCCFASEGRAGDVALGCRKCGDLESESFLAHLAALVGETARHVAAHATNDRAAIAATPSPLPARAWRASEPVDDTPGARYVTRRGAWPAGERFPASVRWLPAASARRVGVRPQLPIGADGCVVYRFGSPGEADTNAAQLEAVNAHGARVLFGAAGKRPSVDRHRRDELGDHTDPAPAERRLRRRH